MTVLEAIQNADALLPGEPIEEGRDPRWSAINAVGEYIQSDPEAVWEFIKRWGTHPQEDIRMAIATCLLEHLLEYHFDAYFPHVESLAYDDPLFASTFQCCSQFGQAEEPGKSEQFVRLQTELKYIHQVHPLYALLRKLESTGIHFTLGRYRPDTILVTLTLVGERVEVDVFEDGNMEVARFPGSESIVGEKELVDQIIEEQIALERLSL